jgi:flagellar basal-body rod protein FlgG
MMQAMSIAATGMDAEDTQLQVIANNLANASTPGFKAGRALFQDLTYEDQRLAGTLSSQVNQVPTGTSIGLGTRTAGVDKIFTEGQLQQTNNPLDIAVEGDGFFQITLPDGTLAYSRDGSFRLNQSGQLVTVDGYPLLPGINVPQGARNITIGPNGVVSVQVNNQNVATQVGQLQLVRFLNPAGLEPLGQNLYTATQAAGPPQIGIPGENGFGTVMQGFLEGSNTSVVQELVGLIEAQRAYEASSKAIQVADTMWGDANGLIA